MLLGFMCLEVDARGFIQDQYSARTIEPLLGVIREFTKYYQAIDKSSTGEPSEEKKPKFGERIDLLLQQLVT